MIGPVGVISAAVRLGRDALAVRRHPPPEDLGFRVAGRSIPAWRYRAGPGAPAVLILHTALGLTVHERALGLALAECGIAATLVRYRHRDTGAVLGEPDRRSAIAAIVEEAFDRLAAATPGGANRVAVLGLSLGGYFALHLGARARGPAPAAVAVWYGIFPSSEPLVPSLRTPLLIVQGGRDRPSLVRSARAVDLALARRGHPSELALYPRAAHQLDLFQSRSPAARDAWRRTVAFLRTALRAEGA